jgi:hypothetical protein
MGDFRATFVQIARRNVLGSEIRLRQLALNRGEV